MPPRTIFWDCKRGCSSNIGFNDHVETETSDRVKGAPIPVTVVGYGRVGSLLADGTKCTIVGHDDFIDAAGTGPIYVATRNDSLDEIVEKCPQVRRKDLVFIQNGYLDNFLNAKGLIGNTQVLLYITVRYQGAVPIDGVTKSNPEGMTAITGEHAYAFANRLAALGLKCKVLSPEEFRQAMFEKLM